MTVVGMSFNEANQDNKIGQLIKSWRTSAGSAAAITM
jgi:hypothetical protein